MLRNFNWELLEIQVDELVIVPRERSLWQTLAKAHQMTRIFNLEATGILKWSQGLHRAECSPCRGCWKQTWAMRSTVNSEECASTRNHEASIHLIWISFSYFYRMCHRTFHFRLTEKKLFSFSAILWFNRVELIKVEMFSGVWSYGVLITAIGDHRNISHQSTARNYWTAAWRVFEIASAQRAYWLRFIGCPLLDW